MGLDEGSFFNKFLERNSAMLLNICLFSNIFSNMAGASHYGMNLTNLFAAYSTLSGGIRQMSGRFR